MKGRVDDGREKDKDEQGKEEGEGEMVKRKRRREREREEEKEKRRTKMKLLIDKIVSIQNCESHSLLSLFSAAHTPFSIYLIHQRVVQAFSSEGRQTGWPAMAFPQNTPSWTPRLCRS